MEFSWLDGSKITVRAESGAVVVSANREGLLSLARIMKTLAEGEPGSHIHLDEYNSLEDGSAELILENTPVQQIGR